MSSGPVLTEYHVSRLMNVALVFLLQERPENKYSRYNKKEFPQICVFEISASKTLKKVSLTSERRIISHVETIQCSCFKGVKTFELLTEIMSRIWWNNSFNITTLWEHVVFTKSSDLWWNYNIGCCFDRRETYVLVSTLSAILASFFFATLSKCKRRYNRWDEQPSANTADVTVSSCGISKKVSPSQTPSEIRQNVKWIHW